MDPPLSLAVLTTFAQCILPRRQCRRAVAVAVAVALARQEEGPATRHAPCTGEPAYHGIPPDTRRTGGGGHPGG
jgi:hypothetical protein